MIWWTVVVALNAVCLGVLVGAATVTTALQRPVRTLPDLVHAVYGVALLAWGATAVTAICALMGFKAWQAILVALVATVAFLLSPAFSRGRRTS